MLVIYSTFPSLDLAQDLSKKAVLEDRVACANILPPIQSFYKWEDQVQDTHELVVLFKVAETKSETFVQWLKDHHPYEVPCIMTIKPESVNSEYLNWVQSI